MSITIDFPAVYYNNEQKTPHKQVLSCPKSENKKLSCCQFNTQCQIVYISVASVSIVSIYFLVLYLSKIDFSLPSIRNGVIHVENFPVVYFEAKQSNYIYLFIDLKLMESPGKGHR